jgi:hypothetical protein
MSGNSVTIVGNITRDPSVRPCMHNRSWTSCPTCRAARSAAMFATRFWTKVDRTAGPLGCWPWIGYQEDGYGRCYWQNRMFGAHELAVTFTTGEARQPGMDTCHLCDNPICCNPDHLRFDTRQGNVDDAVARNRQARGETSGSSKLGEPDVVLIRERSAAGALQNDLAGEYGVSSAAISMIVRGKRWAHVGGPIRRSASHPQMRSRA